MGYKESASFLPLSLAVLLGMIALTSGASLAVMSIDLGNEFMKIGLVKPGVPMEIVLNTESARKTSTIVALKNDGDREFANTAMNSAAKYPGHVFSFLRDLLGKSSANPIVMEFQNRFPQYKLEDDEERATINFVHPDGSKYSVEELLAMILESAKHYAEDYADQKIQDAVIVCPVYFNQAERRALKRAAELAGLKVLQLMTSPAAVALNYGVFRRNEFNSTEQTYMFFDMGSTSTTATVVTYQVVKMKVGSIVETNPQLTVRGVGVDRTLGGLEMTLRLRKHLAEIFNSQKKTTNNVFENPKAMAKLLKEAERVKKILSANTETYAQVENLMDDQDFKAKVNRDEFEAMCGDLFERIASPVQEALKSSEVTLQEINEVILMGGGTRVPIVQEKLMTAINKNELGKSINTDEAAALGAVYQAAHLSTGFKVKTFAVKDANLYPIQVEFERTKTDEDGSATTTKTVKRTLFTRLNPYPQKKVMTFNKHVDDFTFNVNYGDLSFMSPIEFKSFGNLNLASVELSGVGDQIAKHSDNFTENKGVKAHFRLDESGLLNLDSVEVVFEKTPNPDAEESTLSKLSSTISNFFGSGKSEDGEAQESADKVAAESDDQTEPLGDEKTEMDAPQTDESTDKEAQSEKPAAKDKDKNEESEKASEEKTDGAEETKEKPDTADSAKAAEDNSTAPVNKTVEVKPKVIKKELASKITLLDRKDPESDHIQASKDLLVAMTKKDEDKKKLAAVKNELEAFSYDVKNKLYEEEYEASSTEEEREMIREKIGEIMDWYDEQGMDTTLEAFQEKLKEAKKLVKDLYKRVKENKERPRAMDALKSTLNNTKFMLASMKNFSSLDGEGPFTEVELNTLETLYEETRDWMKKMVKDQKLKTAAEVAAYTVEDVATKISALDREVKYLINKAKMWVPKPKKTVANTTESEGAETTTESTEGEAAETQEEKPTQSSDTEEQEATTEKKAEAEQEANAPSSDETVEPLESPPTDDTEEKTDADEHEEL